MHLIEILMKSTMNIVKYKFITVKITIKVVIHTTTYNQVLSLACSEFHDLFHRLTMKTMKIDIFDLLL